LKTGVVGPGAMGCLFSSLLARSGVEVVLFDKREDRARRIDRQGISVYSEEREWKIYVPVISEARDLQDCDLILMAVKSYDTESAARMISEFVGPDSKILTVQNGLGNYEILCRILGEQRVLAGVTRQASTLLSEGCIRHTFNGETVIGAWGPSDSRSFDAIADHLSSGGIPTSTVPDIRPYVHKKLIINAAINPLTGLIGITNGELAEHAGLRRIIRLIVIEACRILAATGFSFDPERLEADVMKTVSDTARNKSSMLQDLERGKRTEIDYINGALASMAEDAGISSPVNSALAELIRSISGSHERSAAESSEYLTRVSADIDQVMSKLG